MAGLTQKRTEQQERIRLLRLGVTPAHSVVTDEYLDLMGKRFIRLRVRELTRVGFEQYLTCPECYEMYAEALRGGSGVRIDEGAQSAVIVIPPKLIGQTYRGF